MKRLLLILLAAGVGFGAASVFWSKRVTSGDSAELARLQAAWEQDKAELEAALRRAQASSRDGSTRTVAAAPALTPAPADPQTLLAELAKLKVANGETRALRQVIIRLELLAQCGEAAVPHIASFLSSGQDVAYGNGINKTPRDLQATVGALAPLTLRLGLFDVLRQIGSENAEAVLAAALSSGSRPFEVAYVTQLLEEMAPGKYRDTALAAAKSLLAIATGPVEREHLFAILKRFGDDTYAATAQALLVQADGKVDRGALKYLQQTIGEQAVAIATQAYRDGRVTEADSKEPLARVALSYVGVSDQAEQLFHTAITDRTLKPDQRRELVEDLNQDGLTNRKVPTPTDLKIITSRYALTQAYLQTDYVQNDKVLNAAFREANKDLNNMIQRAATAATPPK